MDPPRLPGSHWSTDNDHGPLFFSVGWVLTSIAVLSVLARLVTRRAMGKGYYRDDSLVLISLAFGIAQTISITIAVQNGDGKHLSSVSGTQLIALEKSLYAAQIFYPISQAFARVSLGELFRALTPSVWCHRAVLLNDTFIAIWAVVGVLATIFQCQLPHPWQQINNVCIDRKALFVFIDVAAMASDVVLIALPYIILIPTRLNTRIKSIMLTTFSARLLVVGALITHAYFVVDGIGSQVFSFANWPRTIAAELSASLNIITACIPYLKPFYESIQSGMLGTDDLRRRRPSQAYGLSKGGNTISTFKSIIFPSREHEDTDNEPIAMEPRVLNASSAT